MKNKKLIISIIILFIFIFGFGFYFVVKEDKITTLNLFEKQWIEKNKNNIIDMEIVDNIPLLSYSGEGIIIDFLNSLNKETNLSFNKISYKIGTEPKSEYSFKIVDKVEDKQIEIYQDNYAIITKKDVYKDLNEINDITIGVLNENLENVNNYLYNVNVTYKTFKDKDSLLFEFNKKDSNIDAIVLLKTANLNEIIKNNYKIAFNISDYKKYFVLNLGSIDNLNNILIKYYKKWSSNNYKESYNKYFTKNYIDFKNVSDSESVKFRSKRYVYGFIDNPPYDTMLNNKLAGINYQLLSKFSNITEAEISYKKFNSMEDLLKAFNANQIDMFYGLNGKTEYSLDVYNTSPVYENNLVILKHSSNDKIINSIKSVDKISTINNTNIAQLFLDNNINVIPYSNVSTMINKLENEDIIALDLYTYNFYANKLKDYVITYQTNISNNPFIIRNISDNKIFSELIDFYLNFEDTQKFISSGLKELLLVNKTPYILKNIAFVLGIIVTLLLILLSIMKFKKGKTKKNLSKEDKLRYIDSLTSLKNRNYLNDNIEKWDNSETYPQTIVIVDLNNVTYINDNYGHFEGDEIIKQAANILFQNQIPNSEIIRTNGNEFLIYLVGYEEKQVVLFMKKINKEMKELKHGFGAAIGYSMINDEIKTIDDAINEATIDMRNNKEETRE